MRLRRLLCVLLCLPLSLLIVFSGGFIKASAAYSGGRYMTASEALQVFGSTIPGKYFNGSDYTDFNFVYDSSITSSFTPNVSGNSWSYEGSVYLKYTANVSPSLNPQYITCDIQPSYSIFDTSQIHSCIALGGSSSNWVSTQYQSPSWDWYFGGSSYHLENSDESLTSGYHAYFSYNGHTFLYVCADFTSQSVTSGYSSRAVFSGIYGGTYELLIGLPYVDSSANGQTGTFPVTTGGGSSGDTYINVTVDMSETNEKIDESNGFLSSIVSWITDFFSTLGSFFVRLFVPADGFIDNWKEDLAEAIADTFSPVDTVNDTLDRLKQAFDIAGEGSINALEFPAISIPGTSFSTPAVSVPLRPMSDSSIYDRIAKFIDIIATIAVFNMLLNKFKAFLVGEKVVEIENVD